MSFFREGNERIARQCRAMRVLFACASGLRDTKIPLGCSRRVAVIAQSLNTRPRLSVFFFFFAGLRNMLSYVGDARNGRDSTVTTPAVHAEHKTWQKRCSAWFRTHAQTRLVYGQLLGTRNLVGDEFAALSRQVTEFMSHKKSFPVPHLVRCNIRKRVDHATASKCIGTSTQSN